MENGRPASFGGMEKAFSAKIMLRHMEYFGFEEGNAKRLPWKSPETKEVNTKLRRCKRSRTGPWRPWNLLPDGVLLSIIVKLSIVDYFALGRVCRSWRSAALDNKKYYMENLKPLVYVKSKRAKQVCYLFDIFNGEEYKAVLPDLRGKQIMGLSCGYFITMSKSFDFWLVNLMTKDELHFPVLPEQEQKINIFQYGFRALLFKPTMLSRVCMIIFSKKSNFLLLSQSGGKRWDVIPVPICDEISDVKLFGKEIYVLTVDAQIGIFDLSRGTILKLHKSNITIKRPLNSFIHLVILNNQLCMRAFYLSPFDTCVPTITLYELDCETMTWRKKDEMGKYSLFLDDANSAIVDASKWGGVNCICVLKDIFSKTWSLHRLNESHSLAEAPVIWDDDGKLVPLFWYIPNESCSIPVLH